VYYQSLNLYDIKTNVGLTSQDLYLQSPEEHNIEIRVVDLLKGNEGPPPKFDPMRATSLKLLYSKTI
jgi:hypothetical protein